MGIGGYCGQMARMETIGSFASPAGLLVGLI